MAVKPILFNTEMVKAILEDKKTQTRRVVKPQPTLWNVGAWYLKTARFVSRIFSTGMKGHWPYYYDGDAPEKFSPYSVGDIMWVRETWSTTDKCGLFPPWPSNGTHYMYKGDSLEHELVKEARWFPSIHMPKDAARIFLRVLNVRIERLQDITNEGAQREGVRSPYPLLENGAVQEFIPLWDSTLKKPTYLLPAGEPIRGYGSSNLNAVRNRKDGAPHERTDLL